MPGPPAGRSHTWAGRRSRGATTRPRPPCWRESLTHLEKAGDRQGACWAFQYLGRVAQRQGDLGRAGVLFEEALAAAQDVGDKMGIAWSLGNLGRVARSQGDFAQATEWFEEELTPVARHRRSLGRGAGAREPGAGRAGPEDYQRAAALFEESLVRPRAWPVAGDRSPTPYTFWGSSPGAGQPERAGRLIGAAAALREGPGRPVSPLDLAERERQLASIRQALGDRGFAEAWAAGQAMSLEQAVEYALTAPPLKGAPSGRTGSANAEVPVVAAERTGAEVAGLWPAA